MEEYRKYEPVFGAWYFSREIGRGSFGRVFEITREEFGTTYRSALKIISVPQDEDDVRTRLLAEGGDQDTVSDYYNSILREIVNENEIMAQLRGNSNIVSYEDHQIIQHDDGIGYDILIRMELLTPLLDRMAQRKLDETEVVRLGIDICKALEICHRRNIIHRDIKPQNIFISDNGDFKLGDFGIARTIEKTTGGMSKKGTYKYMAPEVYRGEDDYDHTVDLYSLGLVLFSLLNGNRGPFLPASGKITSRDEEAARSRRMRGEPIDDPRDAGAVLAMIIRRACAFYPQDRYSSAAQMRTDLESYLANYGDDDYVEKTVAQFPIGGGGYDPANQGGYSPAGRRTGAYDPVNTGSYNPVDPGMYPPQGDGTGYQQGGYQQGGYSPVGRRTGTYNPVDPGMYPPQGDVAGYQQGGYRQGYTGSYNPVNTGSYNNPYNTQNGIQGLTPEPDPDDKKHKGIIIAAGAVILVLLIVIAGMVIHMMNDDKDTGNTDTGQTASEQNDNTDTSDKSDTSDASDTSGTSDTSDTGSDTVPYEEVTPSEPATPDYSYYDDPSQYYMPDADKKYYTKTDISGHNEEWIQRAINELYARHGYKFKDDGERAYFNSTDWYVPSRDKIDPKSEFNDYEYHNYLILCERREELK